jgi:hypothetical protein
MSVAKNKDKGPAKSSKASQVPAVLAWLFFGPPRGWTWSMVAVLVFAGFSYGLWRRVAPQVLASEDYTVGPGDVDITPLPNWIRTNLAGDVVRGLSLDEPLSILDPDLTHRLHDAFAAQPWVSKVERVSKQHPARIRVDLVYRRPVCMVETPAVPLPGSNITVASRLVPVDADAVLLPERDFPEPQRLQYPRLIGVPVAPPSVAGGRWMDARVIGGAQIAAALVDVWKDFSLDRIVASDTPERSSSNDEYSYEVFTIGGTRIRWGHAPDSRLPYEVPLAEKLSRLKQMKKQNGSLEGYEVIDLTYWHNVRLTPRESRTAARPESETKR